MDLLPTPEQEEIVGSVAAVIAAKHTTGEALDDALWNAAVEQGWLGLGLDESLGGVGYGVAEEVLLFRELGKACVPGPFLASVLGARLAAEAGNADLAAAIVGGEVRVGLAQPYDAGRHSILDGDSVQYALVVDPSAASGTSAVSLVPLDGIEVDPMDSLDVLVPIVVTSGLASATPSAIAPDPESLLLRGHLLVAAQLAGMSQATTEQSVAYGIDRQQFGQPIGSFQAVKHRCADMATRAEVATCEVLYAALALQDGRDDAEFHVHAARVVSANAAIENAQINVQNHGGIGFTWEHSAHRYVTRSRIVASSLGTTPGAIGAALTASAPQ